ncbi:hypothetical protein BH24ACT23_BH24ACT23_11170 [soil metagenome]
MLDTVATETDLMLRRWHSDAVGRAFLSALALGHHGTASLTPRLLRRAVEIDSAYADLGLGLVDASVMAYAERHGLPILTFDFRDFRATASAAGPWELLVEEEELRLARSEN